MLRKMRRIFFENRPTFGEPEVDNYDFYQKLLDYHDKFLDLLCEIGLLKGVNYRNCGREMEISKESSISDGYVFFSFCIYEDTKCNFQNSIKYGSWFNSSKINLGEISILTLEIIIGTKTIDI